MHVSFIVDYYPVLSGRVVFEIANRLKRFGVETTVVSSNLLEKKSEKDVIRLNALHFAVGGTPYIYYNLYDLHKLPCLAKDADIINLHFTIKPLPIYHGLLKKAHLIKSPIVATPHGLPGGYPSAIVKYVSSVLFSVSEVMVLQDSSAIITVSRGEYNFFNSVYPAKTVEYIPNGVDTSEFKPSKSQSQMIRERFHFTEDDMLVLFFAGLRTQKGVFVLLDAIKEIMKKNTRIAFLIVGSGPLGSQVKAFVASQDSRRVQAFTEFVPEKDMSSFYNACDVYVLPSCYEAMPMSLMEAMACGKPVVATSVGDVPVLVEDGINGFLTPPNNVNLLVDKLMYFAEHPEVRDTMGKKNVKEMLRYDWNKTAEGYYNLYRKVLEEAS